MTFKKNQRFKHKLHQSKKRNLFLVTSCLSYVISVIRDTKNTGLLLDLIIIGETLLYILAFNLYISYFRDTSQFVFGDALGASDIYFRIISLLEIASCLFAGIVFIGKPFRSDNLHFF
ncbi:MAG: hypothetical protein K9W46_03795 [Candidatus Heimdallarchaeum endolithica]|uniref:Uncharacterized protein n=1 Tax=Candidatus Heimdallarchaeum endolithica TaxID=2876572 RepID=A0A9Y1BST0_9ARCH|nr:MAG: hypothetical protein K9W46_03795 [Candidatus Heimdallarchaeum endolithica]